MSLAVGLLAVMAAFLVLFSVGAKPAQAVTTFTVNSTGDENDLDFFLTSSDGKCDVDSGTTGDQCTLRAAIQEANVTANSGGPDEIKFNIPGAGPHTIALNTSMTPITEAVTIDGYTQGENTTGTTTDDAEENTIPLATNGTNAVLKIVLDAGAVDTGLEINASNVLVRGLAIHSSTVWGIRAQSAATHLRIEGNFIGTDPGGISDKGNGGPGIRIESANFTVGGETPAARNLISGSGTGIFARDSNVSGAQVEGNLIGTAKDGTSPLPNEGSGVAFENVGTGNSVGGVTAESANTIAFNGDAGVVISGDNARVSVLRNSIFSNGSEGIRLNLTFPLDNLDADTGPNGGQNVPLINTAKTSRKATTIAGTLHSKPNQIYTLRFFSNPPEGSDPQFAQYEGKTFKAQRDTVITDGSGNASFSFKLKGTEKIPKGQFVTAIATASNGDTSMFSPGKRVVRQR